MEADTTFYSGTSWVREEFSSINFGDQRLSERFLKVTENLAAQPQSSINQACGDWASVKAAYRLYANEKVEVGSILSSHQAQILKRAHGESIVLAIQDTTSVNFGLSDSILELGMTGSMESLTYGFHSHGTLACDTSGRPLGLLTQLNWARKRPDGRPYRDLPYSSEPDRWHETMLEAKRVLPGKKVVMVGDREAELYELWSLAEDEKADYLLRARTTKVLQDSGNKSVKAVDHFLKQAPKFAYSIEVPRKKSAKVSRSSRDARIAEVEVYFERVRIKKPSYAPISVKNKELQVSMIYVTEKNNSTDEKIEWLLMTTLPVEDVESAKEKIRWYGYRWRIEMFHKVLKSGCKVESARLGSMDRLEKYLAVMSIVAWRILWLMYETRRRPEALCTEILSKSEYQALYCKTHRTRILPNKVPTLAEATMWIAKLGGFLGRKHDGFPGSTVIWRGWQRLYDITEDWMLFNRDATCG
jgi:hypothetical protein